MGVVAKDQFQTVSMIKLFFKDIYLSVSCYDSVIFNFQYFLLEKLAQSQ